MFEVNFDVLKINLYLFIFSLTILFGCASDTDKELEVELPKIPHDFKIIPIGSNVTFACPKDMLQVENLKLTGDYQFSNLMDVQYAVLQIDSISKGVNLKEFSENKLLDLERKMVDPEIQGTKSFAIGEINGYATEIEADVYGWPSKLHYWITTVELKNKMVTVIAWTTLDRMKEFEKDAELITSSFRRID